MIETFEYLQHFQRPVEIFKEHVNTGLAGLTIRGLLNAYKLITEIPAFLYFLQHRQLTTEKESRMWFSPQQIHTPALDRIINCSRNHTEIDLAEICLNIMDTMSQDKLTFCINDIQQLLLLSNIKVETYQIRNILKRNWKLTPTDNSLAYSTFIKNYPPGPPYREEKKTGRYYTITKEFLRKFR